jgi:transposase
MPKSVERSTKSIIALKSSTHLPLFGEASRELECSKIGLESKEGAITTDIRVENLDHLGIVAGLIDEIGLVELLNERLGIDPREKVSTGIVVKAMLLNGLGFVSAPLYLFKEFFKGKATEQLLGKGIKPEQLNDDRLGKALDELYATGLSDLFLSISLQAAQRFEVKIETAHLVSNVKHFVVSRQSNGG